MCVCEGVCAYGSIHVCMYVYSQSSIPAFQEKRDAEQTRALSVLPSIDQRDHGATRLCVCTYIYIYVCEGERIYGSMYGCMHMHSICPLFMLFRRRRMPNRHELCPHLHRSRRLRASQFQRQLPGCSVAAAELPLQFAGELKP